jgi:hypothetical protein
METGKEYILGQLFNVSLWIHKLCEILCEYYLAKEKLDMEKAYVDAANVLAFVFHIYSSKSEELNLNLEMKLYLAHLGPQRNTDIIRHIKRLQEIMRDHEIDYRSETENGNGNINGKVSLSVTQVAKIHCDKRKKIRHLSSLICGTRSWCQTFHQLFFTMKGLAIYQQYFI